jgi:ABC-type Na+ efflux pump permease subunit
MEQTTMTDPHKYASPEQIRYAKVLGAGVQTGFVLLVLSFLLYLTGVLQPLVPIDQLPKYWGLPVADFVKATNTPTGWGWVALIGKGDMLNLVGIAVLAGISAVSSLAVLPIFARRGEMAHLVIAVLQIVVLVVSASNILTALR